MFGIRLDRRVSTYLPYLCSYIYTYQLTANEWKNIAMHFGCLAINIFLKQEEKTAGLFFFTLSSGQQYKNIYTHVYVVHVPCYFKTTSTLGVIVLMLTAT